MLQSAGNACPPRLCGSGIGRKIDETNRIAVLPIPRMAAGVTQITGEHKRFPPVVAHRIDGSPVMAKSYHWGREAPGMLQIDSKQHLRAVATLAVLFKCALWGLSMPLTQMLVDVCGPCTLGALRLAIALCVFLPILAIQKRRPLLTRETLVLGITGVTLVQVLQNTGLQSVSAGAGIVVLFGGMAISTTILGRLVLGERCTKLVCCALILSGAGVATVALHSSDGTSQRVPLMGTGMILGAALALAIYVIVGKRMSTSGLTALNAGVLLVGFVAILPFALREDRPPADGMLDLRHLAALITLGVAVSAGSYFCWTFGLRHMPVSDASVLSSTEPVFGLVFAWLLVRDGVSEWEVIGVGSIVASCAVAMLVKPKMSASS